MWGLELEDDQRFGIVQSLGASFDAISSRPLGSPHHRGE
jgi:hypothetical protein